MAERLGFEPRKELPLCRFSRPVLSTAQPSLHLEGFIIINIYFKNKIDGGRTGIRTQERVAPLPVFKTGAFNRSAILPYARFYY